MSRRRARRRLRGLRLLGAGLAGALVLGLAWRHVGAGPADAAGTSLPAGATAGGGAMAPPALAPGVPRPATAPDPATAAPSWLAAATSAIGTERARLIGRLQASDDPADALRLFDLLQECMDVRRGRSDDASACDGVTDAALAARHAALQRAVEGRAPGAVAKLFAASPDDLPPDGGRRDAAWRRRLGPLLDDAIRHGDIAALGAGLLEYDLGIDFPRDPQRALACVTAAQAVARERGEDTSGLSLQAARLAAELTVPQRAQAIADGQRLFVDAFQGKPAQ